MDSSHTGIGEGTSFPVLRHRVRNEPRFVVPRERTDQSSIPFVAVLSRRPVDDTNEDDDSSSYSSTTRTAIEWAFFQGKEQTESGSFDINAIEDATDFLAVCERTKVGDGYLVSYGGDLLLKVDNALLSTTPTPALQSSLKLCDLSQPLIQRLVDDDLYKILTLEELYHEQRSKTTSVDNKEGNDNAAGSKLTPQSDMVGSCCHWISSRYDGELLIMRKANTSMSSARLLPSLPLLNKLGFRRAPRANRSWNFIDDSTETVAVDLENLKFVVLDVETHGWTEGVTHVSRSNCIGRVVEMSWIAFNAEYNELAKKSYLLKPHGYQYIQRKAVDFHGITTRCTVENGSDSHLVFDEFGRLLQQIPEDGFVIAHNMNHEDGVMGTNLEGSNLEIWNRIPKCCTMKPSAFPELMLQNGIDVTRRQFIKLVDIHKMIYPEELRLRLDAHDSLADARMAWDVFRYVAQNDQLQSIVWTSSPAFAVRKRFRHTS